MPLWRIDREWIGATLKPGNLCGYGSRGGFRRQASDLPGGVACLTHRHDERQGATNFGFDKGKIGIDLLCHGTSMVSGSNALAFTCGARSTLPGATPR
jgi:hypothetical protein